MLEVEGVNSPHSKSSPKKRQALTDKGPSLLFLIIHCMDWIVPHQNSYVKFLKPVHWEWPLLGMCSIIPLQTVWLFCDPMNRFSLQEYWNGLALRCQSRLNEVVRTQGSLRRRRKISLFLHTFKDAISEWKLFYQYPGLDFIASKIVRK